MTANTWYHYACVFDGTNLLSFVNGELKKTTTSSISTVAVSSSTPIFIGWSAWQYGFSIADVRIYNRALSAAEIAAIYQEE